MACQWTGETGLGVLPCMWPSIPRPRRSWCAGSSTRAPTPMPRRFTVLLRSPSAGDGAILTSSLVRAGELLVLDFAPSGAVAQKSTHPLRRWGDAGANPAGPAPNENAAGRSDVSHVEDRGRFGMPPHVPSPLPQARRTWPPVRVRCGRVWHEMQIAGGRLNAWAHTEAEIN